MKKLLLIAGLAACTETTSEASPPTAEACILALHSGGFGSLIRRTPYDGKITVWLIQVRLRLLRDLALQGTHRLIRALLVL